MKNFKATVGKIYNEERGVFLAMILLLVLSVVLLFTALFTLSPGSSVVKVGYGDIGRFQGGEWQDMRSAGGYRDGSWYLMLAFALFAVILGVCHNVVAVKLFEKRGSGLAKLFIMLSIMLVIGAGVTLIRLLGEG